MTIFPSFQNALCAFLGFFPCLSMPDLHPFSQIVSNQPLFNIPFSLGFLKFYFVCLCILCVLVGCVCGDMCVLQPTYPTYGQRITLCSLVRSLPLFSLELNSGFQACAVNLFTHRTIYYLTSHVFSVRVSLCCSVAVKLTM